MKPVTRSAFLLTFVLGIACAADRPTAPAGETTDAPPDVQRSVASDILVLGAAVVDPPAQWSFRPPSSSMRLAEAEIPGDAGPALLTVFFFGPGGGGGVEANLQRWVGQVDAAQGAEPERGRFTAGAYTVSTVAVEGTLQPSGMGAGPKQPVPGSMLVGAVIEGEGGPWFFKLTGPRETVAGAQLDFDGMLRSVRPAG